MASETPDMHRFRDALAACREAGGLLDEAHPAMLPLDMGHHPELAHVPLNKVHRRVLLPFGNMGASSTWPSNHAHVGNACLVESGVHATCNKS